MGASDVTCSCDCAQQLEIALFDLNYWYWRAIDPEAHARRMREILTDFEVQQFRNEQAKRWAALDAEERKASHERASQDRTVA